MKHYTVRSRYKNPDAFVEKLKRDLAYAYRRVDYFRGEYVTAFGRDEKFTIATDNNNLGVFRAGEGIIVTGIALEVHETQTTSDITLSRLHVSRRPKL